MCGNPTAGLKTAPIYGLSPRAHGLEDTTGEMPHRLRAEHSDDNKDSDDIDHRNEINNNDNIPTYPGKHAS